MSPQVYLLLVQAFILVGVHKHKRCPEYGVQLACLKALAQGQGVHLTRFFEARFSNRIQEFVLHTSTSGCEQRCRPSFARRTLWRYFDGFHWPLSHTSWCQALRKAGNKSAAQRVPLKSSKTSNETKKANGAKIKVAKMGPPMGPPLSTSAEIQKLRSSSRCTVTITTRPSHSHLFCRQELWCTPSAKYDSRSGSREEMVTVRLRYRKAARSGKIWECLLSTRKEDEICRRSESTAVVAQQSFTESYSTGAVQNAVAEGTGGAPTAARNRNPVASAAPQYSSHVWLLL